MEGKISYLVLKKFHQQGTVDSSGSKYTMDGSTFSKGETFDKEEIKQALQICNQHSREKTNTLIVKDEGSVVIWVEDKPYKPDDNKILESNPINTQQPDRQLLTKKVIKRYRGQTYEETVIDWEAMQQTGRQNSIRKYRGQYVD